MKQVNYRQIIGIGLICSLSIALFIGFYSVTIPNARAPGAQMGQLNLSNWNFAEQGLANLNGQWAFYPGRLLSPEELSSGSSGQVSYLNVPQPWRGMRGEGGMARKGVGTYRLRVTVQDADQIYGLKVRSIRMAHRLYIDGKLVGESGEPGADKADTKPGNTPYAAFFKPAEKQFDIVIQVANFEFTTGGVVNSMQLGLHKDITKLNGVQVGTDIGIILILGVFASYHFSLYFLSRREKLYLQTGLYFLCLLVVQLLYGEKIALRLAPGIPFELAYKLLDFGQVMSALMMYLFFKAIDGRIMTSRQLFGLSFPIILYVLSIVVLPYSVLTEAKPFILLYIFLSELYLLVRMIIGYWTERQGGVMRSERLLFIGGIVSLFVYLVDSTLYADNMVNNDMAAKAGVVCFITLMNILLAVRFDTAFAETEKLSRQLLVSNQLKDEFLTQTSHELKTPLHGILNIASFLLEDEERNLSARQKQNLWLVKDTSHKLSMLIHDLIDVTKLKHGEMRMQPSIVDLSVAAQIVADMLQYELAGKPVVLLNQIGDNVWVRADENRLRQVLYNLVHNAIKHTEKGTISMTADTKSGIVHVFVEDTGIGIPLARHEAVFHEFEQQDRPPLQDGYAGMGVGLYISRKLIERMDGVIRVDRSEAGKGTRMRFTLPIAEPSRAMLEASASAEPHKREFAPDEPLDYIGTNAHTILIVDDEASNIHTLLNILKRQRYNVVTAFSAREAIRKLEIHPHVDLVILDVMMPGTSGIELCRMLRENHSILDLPILFATVKDSAQDIALGFRAGANDYITKPFEGATLLARIQTLISMKTSIQEAIRSEHAFHHAQIKPHFLYNALSSVISFCYTDGEKAAYLLSMLSQYLRYILEMDRFTLFVPLHREMELIEAYVEIEKARFGERFNFVCHVDEGLLAKDIPSLCIQPFVENAIRHGLFEKEYYGRVVLSIQEGDRYMKIIVEDDGVGMPDDLLYRMMSEEKTVRGGIGIQNIRKRLASIPGASLNVHSELGKGTKVTMYLPFLEAGSHAGVREGGGGLV